jgi:hypothetical protein
MSCRRSFVGFEDPDDEQDDERQQHHEQEEQETVHYDNEGEHEQQEQPQPQAEWATSEGSNSCLFRGCWDFRLAASLVAPRAPLYPLAVRTVLEVWLGDSEPKTRTESESVGRGPTAQTRGHRDFAEACTLSANDEKVSHQLGGLLGIDLLPMFASRAFDVRDE